MRLYIFGRGYKVLFLPHVFHKTRHEAAEFSLWTGFHNCWYSLLLCRKLKQNATVHFSLRNIFVSHSAIQRSINSSITKSGYIMTWIFELQLHNLLLATAHCSHLFFFFPHLCFGSHPHWLAPAEPRRKNGAPGHRQNKQICNCVFYHPIKFGDLYFCVSSCFLPY